MLLEGGVDDVERSDEGAVETASVSRDTVDTDVPEADKGWSFEERQKYLSYCAH